jgi:hypothetical protein
MRGPAYTETEIELLRKLAAREGSLKELAEQFREKYEGRSVQAVSQQLRKLRDVDADPSAKRPKRRKRKASAAVPKRNGKVLHANGKALHTNGKAPLEGRFESSDGLIITGPAHRVAEVAAQL